MADTGNLGQYKVIVAADYSNLTKGISDVLKSIQSSADGVSSIFSKMTENIEKASINSKSFDSVKQSIDGAKDSINSLNKQTSEAGNSADSATQKYKTLQSQLREARMESEKVFGTKEAFNTAKGNYDTILSRLESFKTAIGDNRESSLQSEQKIQRALEKSVQLKEKNYQQYLAQTAKESTALDEFDRNRELSQTKAYDAAMAQREKVLQEEQKIRNAIENTNNKQNEYISNLKAQQSTSSNNQYWKDEESRIKSNSSLIKQQMQERVSLEEEALKKAQTISDLKAQQNRQSNSQYYKDIESQQKRNSELIQSQMQSRVNAENEQKKVVEEAGKAQQKAMLDAARSASTYESVLSKVRGHMLWMASAGIAGAIFAAPFEAIHTIADVEKQMAGMVQVLPQLHGNQQALNTVSQQFITIAEQYGMQVDKIIEAGKLWGRGYKDVGEIMQLTGLSAKLATADMMDVTLANRAVESTINSFGRQADAVSYASHVVDSWTNIAHNAQSSATDLAEALMRSGAAAHAVGVSLDTTNALASTMIKTTGLEGANVGNALKSIFSSIHSDKAVADLKNLGIEVSSFDKNGTQHFRDVSSVITDLMLKTHETSTNMAKDLQDISGGRPKLAA